MKLILPVAGKGERMRPYTNNIPKCLLPVGGKTIIDWIVDKASKLLPSETIFITGYLANKVESYINSHPQMGNVFMIHQDCPQGLGEAVNLALTHVTDDEPILIILGDTLFDADLTNLKESTENVIYTYNVKDPHRFGVAVTDNNGYINQLIEKPQEFVSNEAIVGIYYITDVKALKSALKHIIDEKIRTQGEFQLTDALQMMIKQGCKFRTSTIKKWLDCGLPETLIKTNTWLLENTTELNNINQNNTKWTTPIHKTEITPPCIIGDNVVLENCSIGPNVSIGNNCILKNSTIRNSIIWDGVSIDNVNFDEKIIAKT